MEWASPVEMDRVRERQREEKAMTDVKIQYQYFT